MRRKQKMPVSALSPKLFDDNPDVVVTTIGEVRKTKWEWFDPWAQDPDWITTPPAFDGPRSDDDPILARPPIPRKIAVFMDEDIVRYLAVKSGNEKIYKPCAEAIRKLGSGKRFSDGWPDEGYKD